MLRALLAAEVLEFAVGHFHNVGVACGSGHGNLRWRAASVVLVGGIEGALSKGICTFDRCAQTLCFEVMAEKVDQRCPTS